MRILLDAYFDNNFGDDLFITTLLERYPDALFYAFWNKTHPAVLEKALDYRNLVMLPGQCELRGAMPFDGYVMIGGDVLPDGIDYGWRIDGMRQVKERGGFVAMLGFSLYEAYGEKTRQDLAAMAALADSIVARDRASAERFRALVPEAKVTESTDMAFAKPHRDRGNGGSPILGIAPRRKLYSTDQEHEDFCKAMAAVADGWLKNHPTGTVRFLALSTGEYDDRVTAADIRGFMAAPERTETVAHTGTVPAFLERVAECTAMVPTRFHGLVFALIYGIPFVPVPYEVKLTQLLDEIGYEGTRIPYGQAVTEAVIAQTVAELDQKFENREAVEKYRAKADLFFADADRLFREERARKFVPTFGCAKLEENIALKLENDQLRRDKEYLENQVLELQKWVEALQQQRQAFEAQNQELEAIRVRQEEQLQKIYKRFPPAKLLAK